MNATQHYGPTHGYLDTHSQHLGHESSALTATSYPAYHTPMMTAVQGSYAPTGPSTGYYAYTSTPTSMSSHATYGHHSLPSIPSLAAMTQPPTPVASGHPGYESDPTGQTGPPNKRSKITATLWEDENTLCFQVEANGICVARRADNCYINGTKLLNVANMTRGRRDGLLKGEKNRKVVKIGPMHLKGVWIPFERALDYANKEKITDILYPLFVHNVEQFLQQSGYHPPQTIAQRGTTSNNTNYGHVRNSSTLSQAPSMHSASSSVNLAHPASSHHVHGRPSIDRAHTLPTPPTTAHSNVVPAIGGSYDWANAAAHHVDHGTGLTNAKSLPTSPTNTPPEHTLQQIQYSTAAQPTYDSRMYSMQPPSYTLPTAHLGYGKTEMLPPPSRKLETVVKEEGEVVRPDSGYTVNGSETQEQQQQQQYQRPYTNQHSGSAHSANVSNVESHKRSISPENNTTRPLSAGTPQTHHWQQKAYTTPHRISAADYRPMSADSSHMHSAHHSYSASGTPQTYYAYANGATPTHAQSTNKRLRDIDEEDEDGYCRSSSSHGGDYDGGLKRRKTVREGIDNVARPIATPSALSRSRSMNYQRR